MNTSSGSGGLRYIPLGVRATFPVAKGSFLEYGGNTLSVLFIKGRTGILIDTGTGILNLPPYLSEIDNLYVFSSHYHIDHLMALSFLHSVSQKTNVYIVHKETVEQPMFLISFVSDPLTPIPFGDFFKNIRFLRYRTHVILDDLKVSCFPLAHPGSARGYVVESVDRKVVTMFDHEQPFFDTDAFKDTLDGTTHLIFDTTYRDEDYMEGWGHSTFNMGVNMAALLKCRLFCIHYNFTYDDEMMKEIERSTAAAGRAAGVPEVTFSRENTVYHI